MKNPYTENELRRRRLDLEADKHNDELWLEVYKIETKRKTERNKLTLILIVFAAYLVYLLLLVHGL